MAQSRKETEEWVERCFNDLSEAFIGLRSGLLWQRIPIKFRDIKTGKCKVVQSLHISEAVTELVGGSHDGTEVFAGFLCDIFHIAYTLTDFDDDNEVVRSCQVMMNCMVSSKEQPTESRLAENLISPYLLFQGRYEGRKINVFVHSRPITKGADILCDQDGNIRLKRPEGG